MMRPTHNIHDNSFFLLTHTHKHTHTHTPVSVCVLLYGIILIQILIKYNAKKSHYCMHQITWFWPPKLKNLPTATPSPRSVASLPRICSLNIFCVFLEVRNHPPTFEDLSTPLHTHTCADNRGLFFLQEFYTQPWTYTSEFSRITMDFCVCVSSI